MKNEIIDAVEILGNKELLLKLKSSGESSYQYIYREGLAVYWDNDLKGFKSSGAPNNWSYSQWFLHIISTVKSALGVNLELLKETAWLNVEDDVKSQILNDLSKNNL